MSMQQGAKTVNELMKVIKELATDMQEFSDCENAPVREIVITIDEDDNSFTITSD
ncbi:hypothetical protein Q7A53_05275 [Halobacillus rhizosphaerae]|uniref:hypothetical protein n=1 Tax=Halobacillus rhizosphaerae TaxID=3064889 RepID=UPI00398B82E4